VYYVPDLKSNILSMGQLMEKGYSVLMKDRVLYLKDKSDRLIVQVEMKKNRMYKLDLKIVQVRCLKLDMKDEDMMWHFRFGHLHFGGLAELVKRRWCEDSRMWSLKRNFVKSACSGSIQGPYF